MGGLLAKMLQTKLNADMVVAVRDAKYNGFVKLLGGDESAEPGDVSYRCIECSTY